MLEWEVVNVIKAALTVLFTWILLTSFSACGIQAGGVHLGTTSYFELLKEREAQQLKETKKVKHERI